MPTAHRRYFLKIYFLPELLGNNCVRSVLTDGREKTDDNYLGETYKEDRAAISAIYYLSDCQLAFCQKADRTADSRITRSVCAVTGSNKKLSLSVGSVDGRECLLRTGSGAVGRFGR